MKKFLFLTLTLLALLIAGCSEEEAPTATTPTFTTTQTTPITTAPSPTATPFELEFGVKYKVKVVDVIDGDTIDVLLPDGSIERVRMLGVDTPETTASKNKPYEYDDITDLDCLAEWGMKAKQYAESHLLGKYVYIEFDELAGLRGYYGRLLAYVYTDSNDFTAELVKQGYARVYEEGECKKEQEYLNYQQEAISAGAGLWGACTSTLEEEKTESCDPSYPDVCIPPPPPDLDCKDVPYRNFKVLPPDPHHFDGDHDGIGCEQ